jgi:hypothetical protein
VYECRAFDWDGPKQITKAAQGPWDRVVRCERPRLGARARLVHDVPEWIEPEPSIPEEP